MEAHPIWSVFRRRIMALVAMALLFLIHGLSLRFYAGATWEAACIDALVSVGILSLLSYLLWFVVGFISSLFISFSAALFAVVCAMIGQWLAWELAGWLTGTDYVSFVYSIPFRLFAVVATILIQFLWYRLIEKENELENSLAELVCCRDRLSAVHEKPETVLPATEVPAEDRAETAWIDRVVVKDRSRIHIVELPDLLCIQACGDYVTLTTTAGEYVQEQTMKYFEANLPPDRFIRVHRSAIVQIACIVQLELYGKESYLLQLRNGMKIKVSNAGYKLLRSRLGL